MTVVYVWPPKSSSDHGRKPTAVELPGELGSVHARPGKEWRTKGDAIEYPSSEVHPELNECRLRVMVDELAYRATWPPRWRWLHGLLYTLWPPYRIAVRRAAWLIAVIEYGVEPALASRFVSRRVSSREWFVEARAHVEVLLYASKD